MRIHIKLTLRSSLIDRFMNNEDLVKWRNIEKNH